MSLFCEWLCSKRPVAYAAGFFLPMRYLELLSVGWMEARRLYKTD